MELPRVPQRTTPGFAFSMVDRCLKDCLGTRKFGQGEAREVLMFFFGDGAPECVFCGSADIGRWDHLVPVTKGGETVLGNMVPSCARCDDSMQDVDFAKWMESDARHSPKSRGVTDIGQRIQRIKSYMNRFGYKPCLLEERLTEEEQERLSAIRIDLGQIRKTVEALICDYQERQGPQ